SLSNCSVDRALELWFLVPEELSQFHTNGCKDVTLQPCNDSTLQRFSGLTLPPCNDSPPQPNPSIHQSTNPSIPAPCNASTVQRSNASTPPRSDAPPTLNSQLSPASPADCEAFTRLAGFSP